MRDDRPTSKMEAFDLRLLSDATVVSDRPTMQMEPLAAHTLARTAMLDTLELALEPREALPQLRVIVTPPEVRERWETWVRIRTSIALAIAMTVLLVAVIGLV